MCFPVRNLSVPTEHHIIAGNYAAICSIGCHFSTRASMPRISLLQREVHCGGSRWLDDCVHDWLW
jgi:hypothetical protein